MGREVAHARAPARRTPGRICAVEGCEHRVTARGWCNKHYLRWRAHGNPLTLLGPVPPHPMRDPAERFWEKVDTSGECWVWTSPKRVRFRGLEYGQFHFDGGPILAHRFAYELLVGPIPKGKELDHACRNTLCVNPAHLEPVVHRTNVLRGESPSAEAARRTTCAKGHPYDEANTYLTRAGHRRCRRCHAQDEARHRERKRLQEVAA